MKITKATAELVTSQRNATHVAVREGSACASPEASETPRSIAAPRPIATALVETGCARGDDGGRGGRNRGEDDRKERQGGKGDRELAVGDERDAGKGKGCTRKRLGTEFLHPQGEREHKRGEGDACEDDRGDAGGDEEEPPVDQDVRDAKREGAVQERRLERRPLRERDAAGERDSEESRGGDGETQARAPEGRELGVREA